MAPRPSPSVREHNRTSRGARAWCEFAARPANSASQPPTITVAHSPRLAGGQPADAPAPPAPPAPGPRRDESNSLFRRHPGSRTSRLAQESPRAIGSNRANRAVLGPGCLRCRATPPPTLRTPSRRRKLPAQKRGTLPIFLTKCRRVPEGGPVASSDRSSNTDLEWSPPPLLLHASAMTLADQVEAHTPTPRRCSRPRRAGGRGGGWRIPSASRRYRPTD